MLDTNAVNFVINKMSSKLNTVLPDIKDFSSEYIKFEVTKCYLSTIGFLMLFIALFVIWYFIAYKRVKALNNKEKEAGYDDTHYDDEVFIIPTVFCGLFGLALFIAFVCCLHDAILAWINPTMFVLNNLLNK